MEGRIAASYFMGGFECSTHRLRTGRRLDLAASTRHEEFASEDYARLARVGIRTARDGIRWHLIEALPGRYDFDGARRMVRAALQEGVQVMWDILHFGWPDHVDPFHEDFPKRLGAFAHAFAEVLRSEGDFAPLLAPVNEISFLAFAGGEAGFFNPFAHGKGDALKHQLIRGALAAGRAARDVNPATRLVHTDPIIHVIARPDHPEDEPAARAHEEAQYASWDAIAGRAHPELGGSPDMLDLLGVNYYVHNQWAYPGGHRSMVRPSSARYRPVHEMLATVYARYGRPLFIAETGIEEAPRPEWLAYMAHEARTAIRRGVECFGLCLYPIVNHPGWDDDRHCNNGLWDYADDLGDRPVYVPLAEELARQRVLQERLGHPGSEAHDPAPDLARFDSIAEWVAEVTERYRE
ncbi:MAG TPA: beta-glucosidase [Candidatus Eisenbacteria bacterium]|nr:beta-glucosidase [Candidatus Eisenbacteria bacterium]